jgi:hypothetical protein
VLFRLGGEEVDVNTEAKRIHNIAPRPVRLSFRDGTTVDLKVRMAEFFQEAFQGEGVDAEGRTYRLVSDGADDPLVAGRETGEGWETVGEVVAVERVGTNGQPRNDPRGVLRGKTASRAFRHAGARSAPTCEGGDLNHGRGRPAPWPEIPVAVGRSRPFAPRHAREGI